MLCLIDSVSSSASGKEGSKPVKWVNVDKNAGTTLCRLAKVKKRVVEPNDGTCNSLALVDAFYPHGLAQKRPYQPLRRAVVGSLRTAQSGDRKSVV